MSTKNSVFMEYNSFKFWQAPYDNDLPPLFDDEKKHMSTKDNINTALETIDKAIRFVSNYNIASRKNYTFHFVGIRDNNNNSQIKIFDNLSAVSISTNLNLDSPFQSLHALIRKEFDIDDHSKVLLFYSNSILVANKMTNLLKLQDCGITNHSCFLLALQDTKTCTNNIETKTNIMNNNDENKNDPQIFDDLKQLVWTKSIQRGISLDVITQQNNVNIFKMPYCNHSMAKESLYQYILSEFMNKKQNITCPHTKSKHKNSSVLCGQLWDYPTLKQYLLTKDEFESKHENENKNPLQYMKYVKLEIYSARNIAENKYKLQRCSKCKTIYYRYKNMQTAMIKNVSQSQGNNFIQTYQQNEKIILQFRCHCMLCNNVFCFGCGNEWCDKHLCDESFRLQTLNILATCSEKDIDECYDVPEVRACPKCGQLINHVEDCKHMKCDQCNCNFCFVCLQLKDESNEWPCGEYDEECDVHPRQNDEALPNLSQKNIFQLF